MKAFASKILVSILILNALNAQGGDVCTPKEWLDKYNFTALAPPVAVTGTCKGAFDTGKACVSATVLKNYFAMITTNLKDRAIDAYDYSQLLGLADKYFYNVNNNISTGILNTSGNSWWQNILSGVTSFFTSLWTTVSTWALSLFNKSQTKIPTCFRAWNAVSQGALCLFSSVNNEGAATADAKNFALKADITTTGTALEECLDLINNYCVLTYGVALSQTSSPYNKTFTWSDGGMTLADCNALKLVFTCDAANTDCLLNRRTQLVKFFNHYDLPFVTNKANVANLNNFLLNDPIKQPDTFVPIQNAAVQNRVVLTPTTTSNNVKLLGDNSGETVADFPYSSTRLKGAFKLALVSFLGFALFWRN